MLKNTRKVSGKISSVLVGQDGPAGPSDRVVQGRPQSAETGTVLTHDFLKNIPQPIPSTIDSQKKRISDSNRGQLKIMWHRITIINGRNF